ncbi:MAG TPA: glycosyltransferase family 4 protein, partial [Candidatus Saccharimonadales bacterium]|nr:glycosyltransferase family 4 protein [Candidatus Saccharimonadales bacterium]
MKILHVCKKYPPILGGDAIVVSHLVNQHLANHDIVIVTSNCVGIPNDPHIYKLGLADTPSGLDAITLKRIISLFIIFFRMFAILYKERPHVIHTHSVDMAFFASFAARFFNIPLVHTFHIVTFYDTQQSALRRKSELWLLQKAKPCFVTAPNNYDVQKLQAAGVHQAVLLPNGVDLTFWTPSEPAHNKQFTFLAVGRLEDQKGYTYLIKAVAQLTKKVTEPFSVMIIGEGSQKNALKELAHAHNVDHLVELAGGKTPKQTRALLKKADALVCPSLYETTPLTLLEAWATKTPVI